MCYILLVSSGMHTDIEIFITFKILQLIYEYIRRVINGIMENTE